MQDYSIYFSHIIGYEPIKQELYRVLDLMHHPDKYEALGAQKDRGIILSGDAGVGKTTMANAFLKASGYKSFVIRKNAAEEDFTKYLKDVFDEASRQSHAIVLLDDIDKYISKKNDECFSIIQALIDNTPKSVFFIATANDYMTMPKSLLRHGRFGIQIEVNKPNEEDSRKIIEYYLQDKKVSKDLDAETIRRFLNGYTVATLESVIAQAGVYAAYDDCKEIELKHLLRAFMRIVYMVPDPDSINLNDKKNCRTVALHEVGHALVSEILEPNSVSLVSIKDKSRSSQIQGFIIRDEDKYDCYSDVDLMMNKMTVLLAGKAAVELYEGKPAMGCGDDVRHALELAQNLIDWSATTSLFNVAGERYEESVPNELLSRQFIIKQTYIDLCFKKAKQIIANNKMFFDNLYNEIFKEGYLTFRDIARIKSTCNIVIPSLI